MHLEFGAYDLPVAIDEKESILVIAGDLGVAKKVKQIANFLESVAYRFHTVIYIMGNHEYYRYSFITGMDKIKNEPRIAAIENLHILERESIVIDDMLFLCTTMWTDLNRDPLAKMLASDRMNDYATIRMGSKKEPFKRRFTPDDSCAENFLSEAWLISCLREYDNFDGHIIVVTHHSPTDRSMTSKYRQDPNWIAYANSYEQYILDYKPALWIHGHIHEFNDYWIGNTRIVSNPRGYQGHAIVHQFHPKLTITI